MGSKGYPVPDRISHLREGGGGVDSFRHTNKLTSEAGIDRQFQGPITKVIRYRPLAATAYHSATSSLGHSSWSCHLRAAVHGMHVRYILPGTVPKNFKINFRMETSAWKSPHVVRVLFGDQRPLFEVGLELRQRRGRRPSQIS